MNNYFPTLIYTRKDLSGVEQLVISPIFIKINNSLPSKLLKRT